MPEIRGRGTIGVYFRIGYWSLKGELTSGNTGTGSVQAYSVQSSSECRSVSLYLFIVLREKKGRLGFLLMYKNFF